MIRAIPSPEPTQPELLPGPIAFVLFPRYAMIALASAIEPLRIANRYLAKPYEWRLLTQDGEPVEDRNGISIRPHGALHSTEVGSVILCADTDPELNYSGQLGTWLHGVAARGGTLGALDTGAFLLARAGLLDGRRVTLHWEVAQAFQERFPTISVFQTLFEIDGGRMTCAGGTAAIDMMLGAIAIDHGIKLANRVAEHCLHGDIRQGQLKQRMDTVLRHRAHHPALVKALRLLEATLDRPVRIDELADSCLVSSRQLARLFSQALGEGPGQYHRQLRLEHARNLLRHTSLSVTEVAIAAGFDSLAHFSRSFRQRYGVPPGHERAHEQKGMPLRRR